MPQILKVKVRGWTQTLEQSVTSSAGVDDGRKIILDYPLQSVTGVWDNADGTGTNYWTEFSSGTPQARERMNRHFEHYILLPAGTTLSASTSCWITYEVWRGYMPLEGQLGAGGRVGLSEVWSKNAINTFATEMTDRNTGIAERVYLEPRVGGMVVKSTKVVTDGTDVDVYIYDAPGTTTADSYATSNQDTDQNVGNDTNNAAGQSFAGNGAVLLTARLWLKKVSSPTGTAVCKIYASTGSDPNRTPTGSALATSDTIDVSTIGGTYENVDFTFSTEYTLVNATVYFIVLEHDGTAVNYLHWGTDTSAAGHASNNFAVYTSAWADAATTDGCFYIFTEGDPVDSSIIYKYETISGIEIDNRDWVIDGDLTYVYIGYVDAGTDATPASTTVELRGASLI